MVSQGGFERLRAADFPDDQPTKDCVVKTIKRITVRLSFLNMISPGASHKLVLCYDIVLLFVVVNLRKLACRCYVFIAHLCCVARA